MPDGRFELAGWAQTWLCHRCAGKALSAEVGAGSKFFAGVLGVASFGAFILIVANFATGYRLLGLLDVLLLILVSIGAGYGMHRLSGGNRVNNPRPDDPDLSATVHAEELAIRLRREEYARAGFDTLLTRLAYAQRTAAQPVPDGSSGRPPSFH